MRRHVSRLSRFSLALLATCALASASAQDKDHINWLLKVGDYAEIYRLFYLGALSGDSEKQELVANLLLGPHGQKIKHQPYEGVRFLYLAAVAGRPTAIAKLSAALDKGGFGLKQSTAAAQCWSKAPAAFEGKLICIGLTEFRDRRARPHCYDIKGAASEQSANRNQGEAVARLCLANKTPALLVPGPPPSEQDEQRAREWARHGIEWQITGDVYEDEFEKFRNAFNSTMVAAIERERGPGYLDKLGKEIDARVAAPARKKD
jgi:hypothetical protein